MHGQKILIGTEVSSLESRFEPVTNPIELHSLNWKEVSLKLMKNEEYKDLFQLAFNTRIIDSINIVKAIAQFERTLISGDSKFDKFLDYRSSLTASELRGKEIFTTEKEIVFIVTHIRYLLAMIFIIMVLTLSLI